MEARRRCRRRIPPPSPSLPHLPLPLSFSFFSHRVASCQRQRRLPADSPFDSRFLHATGSGRRAVEGGIIRICGGFCSRRRPLLLPTEALEQARQGTVMACRTLFGEGMWGGESVRNSPPREGAAVRAAASGPWRRRRGYPMRGHARSSHRLAITSRVPAIFLSLTMDHLLPARYPRPERAVAPQRRGGQGPANLPRSSSGNAGQ